MVKKLTAYYGGTNVHTYRSMCPRVDVTFDDFDSALKFWSILKEPQQNKLDGELLFVANYPVKRMLSDGTQIAYVELYLGFGVSNVGYRADSILNFLSDNFKLPSHFEISYPDEANTAPGDVPKWKSMTLPMVERSLLKLDLAPFLKGCSLIEDATLFEKKFCALLDVEEGGIQVKAEIYDPTFITISCVTPELAKQLKGRLFKLAQDHDCDESFRFESISGVAGMGHSNLFKIKANDGVVLREVVHKLCPDCSSVVAESGPASSGL